MNSKEIRKHMGKSKFNTDCIEWKFKGVKDRTKIPANNEEMYSSS